MLCLRDVREGKVRFNKPTETKLCCYLGSELQMRYSDILSEQAYLHLCCLHGHMVVVGLFDFMLSDHGKQLRSCRDGQLSLLHNLG